MGFRGFDYIGVSLLVQRLLKESGELARRIFECPGCNDKCVYTQLSSRRRLQAWLCRGFGSKGFILWSKP